jgi:integrase
LVASEILPPNKAIKMDAQVGRAAGRQPKKTLNDRTLKALKPAGKGTYDRMDPLVPGFGVRVSEVGRKTFVLAARYPGSPFYARRALGVYGAMSLEKARAKAKAWLELIERGIDPKAEEERLKIAEQRKRENSFRMVAESYVAQAVIGPDPDRPRQRKADEVERSIEKEFVSAWGGRPVADITSDDVEAAIQTVVARGSPGQARNLLGIAKTLFGWAARQKRFGLKASPCGELKAKHLIGAKASTDRILSDGEIAAFWRNVDRLTPTDPRNRGIAAGRLGYPYGPLYKMLLLSGLRLNECGDARWGEFDLKEKLWTIPKERMKGTNEKARAHAVPLTDDMLAILGELPRFKGGDFLFSVTGGRTPVWASAKVKKKLDARMLRSLRALARMRGEDPAKVKLDPWVNHDLRRTLRSGLSRLRVDHDVKEAVLAHVKTGIAGVYDRYEFLDEKREALTLWAGRLRDIVSPPPDNLVKFQTTGRA